jgi:hypothetical protein
MSFISSVFEICWESACGEDCGAAVERVSVPEAAEPEAAELEAAGLEVEEPDPAELDAAEPDAVGPEAGAAAAGGLRRAVKTGAPFPEDGLCCANPERDSRARQTPAAAGAILERVSFM